MAAKNKTMESQGCVDNTEQEQAASTYLEVESQLRKKAKFSSPSEESATCQVEEAHEPSENCIPTDTTVAANLKTVSKRNGTEEKKDSSAQSRCGRWSLNEKLMFLYGLSVYGKGRWKKISAYVPDRYVNILVVAFKCIIWFWLSLTSSPQISGPNQKPRSEGSETNGCRRKCVSAPGGASGSINGVSGRG